MFDSLLQEVAKKFGLGNKASWILSALLGLIFNRNNGGMSGFLEKLTHGGLGQMVNSWLGKGEPMAIDATQLEKAMGSGIISNLASKLGLGNGPVGMALAYMLPKVVSGLTPDGVVPDNIPAGVAHYIKDDGQVTGTEVRTQFQQDDYAHAAETDREGSGFSWWWLLLPLFLLLGWCGLRQQPDETLVSTTSPVVSAPEVEVVSEPVVPVTPVPSINSSLSISNESDSFNVSGTVADNATKESIFGMLNSVVGSDKVSGDINVDPAAKEAGWLAKLSGILPALKGVPGAKLSIDGDDVTLDGTLEQGAIDGLMGQLNGVFGGSNFNISSQAVGVAASTQVLEAVVEPLNSAQAVLGDVSATGANAIQDMVTSGTVTGESLVSALNMAGINFASGSFNIASDSQGVLRDAAEAIKAAPADTRIQVGGHTDNTGSSQINTRLSGQRAQAVVDALVGMGVDASILNAKGYGDTQPIADNGSEAGRAQNRRMEFTLQ